jgi:hypothetical protein
MIGVSLAAVAAASATPPPSGLYGTVRRGPTTPVCRSGVPCDAPAPNVLLTFSRMGLARDARTDQHGAYRIRLPPGVYSVRTNSKPFGQTPHPATIRVRAGHTDKIVFTIDTGIR